MNDPYELIEGEPGWIRVCAWCFPGQKIFDLFPDLRGQVEISHSICPAHRERCVAKLKAGLQAAFSWQGLLAMRSMNSHE